MAWFIAVPSERRFIYPGIYILISLIGILVAMVGRMLRPQVGWIFAAVMCLGLMLANARSLFVTLAILLLVGLLGWRLVHKKFRLAHLVWIFATGATMVTLAAFLFLRTEAGRDLAERSAEQLASGVLNSGEDPTWQFRLSAWKEAWRRFAEYPLAGEGFGVPFTFEGLLFENDPRPHNTFLTVLYKMGFCGFLPLVALLMCFLSGGLRSVHRYRNRQRIALLEMVLVAQAAFCLFGMGNLLLESPFLASFFWVLMGLSLRITRMLDMDGTLHWAISGSSGADGTNSISR
jgi:O-antigen ligase